MLESRELRPSDDLEKDENPLTITFAFNPKIEYAPRAFIVAYFVTKSGEIVAATAQVELRDKLPNAVSEECFAKFHIIKFFKHKFISQN